ncbi:Salicylate hydroxylase [Hypsizygus marmoreus]|uniref:Salicylate hydroxylase n=1 Tax=Hypsizygus marmoreus TaxID=39966 RepID=A0A369KC78_HYPMA|nr:Salicylate hydroxylase [Hypsizygus marmoreus]
MSSPRKDFKVAIVGGGMCGLLCAVGLARAGIQVNVFESATKFGEVGAGVGLGPNAIRALDGLGVLEAILRRTDEPTTESLSFRFITGVGNHDHVYLYPVPSNHTGIGIYRPAFLEALEPLIDAKIVHFGKRCISISTCTSRSHLLHFEGGDVHEADLVIGADGIRSVVRSFVDPETTGRVVYSNSVAYRSLLSLQSLKEAGVKTDLTSQPLCWVGNNKHIITYPVQAKKMINIVAFSTSSEAPVGSNTIDPPWVRSASQNEILDAFSGWGDDAITLLKQMANPSKWYLHSMNPPLKNYIKQRVVLIGDAAHPMVPHLGAGVGQGFEDTLALCKLLSHRQTRRENLDVVLDAYNAIRVPRARAPTTAKSKRRNT